MLSCSWLILYLIPDDKGDSTGVFVSWFVFLLLRFMHQLAKISIKIIAKIGPSTAQAAVSIGATPMMAR